MLYLLCNYFTPGKFTNYLVCNKDIPHKNVTLGCLLAIKGKRQDSTDGIISFIIVHSHKHTAHIQGPLSFCVEEAEYAGVRTLL